MLQRGASHIETTNFRNWDNLQEILIGQSIERARYFYFILLYDSNTAY